MRIRVQELSVMQDGYRLPASQMQNLFDHVRSGGRFDRDSLQHYGGADERLAAIVRFENGLLAIRDGLHRMTAILLARASGMVESSEFVLEEQTFEMFRHSNLAEVFYAPFDPLTEVRTADLDPFWRAVKLQLVTGPSTEDFIHANRHLYVRRRQAWHESLSAFYLHSGAQYNGCLTAQEEGTT